FDIGVAPADMGDDHRVLACKCAKQLIRRVDGSARGLSFDENVRRAPDRAALAPEEDIAVAAHAGIARPLVTAPADEPARPNTRGPSPRLIATVCGNPRIGCDGTSASCCSASPVGLPHASSATMARRNGSPTTASEGQIAFQCAAGPGTSAKAGCSGSSVNS